MRKCSFVLIFVSFFLFVFIDSSIAIKLYENDYLTVQPGDLYERIFAYDTSSVVFNGGVVEDSSSFYDNSTLDMYGGSFNSIVCTLNSNLSNFYGGDIYVVQTNGISTANLYESNLKAAIVYNSSVFNIYGGTIENYLSAGDDATVNFYGGNIVDRLHAYSNSTINIYGYNINYDPYSGYDGQITGLWEDGSYFSIDLIDYSGHSTYEHVVLHDLSTPVPEPSTMLLVATGLIGLVGFRKKFKK